MAGPNDHHVVVDKLTGSHEVLPGLGKDEPSELQKRAAQIAGDTMSRKLKDELKKQADGLTALERDLNAEKEALARKAAELEARENALTKAESEAAAAKKGGAR